MRPRSSGSSLRATFASSLLAAATLAAHGQAATTTTLAVASGSSPVTTVSQGSVVTLTATVLAGSTPVTAGQVNFCVVSSTAACTDIHLIGTAQLTSAGTAIFRFQPATGSHTYKAVFLGSPHGAMRTAGSASASTALNVTAAVEPTVTQVLDIAFPSNPNPPYPLTVLVGGNGSAPPTGSVSFINTSDSNAIIGSATIGSGQSKLNLLNSSALALPDKDSDADAIVAGDFNNDGILDLAVALNSQDIQIFLGDGHGGFTPGQTILSSGTVDQVMLAADFNGDGNLDLAINTPQNGLYVFLGNGDGTFATSPVITATGFLIPVAVADFNLDGIPDIAASSSNQTQVIILLGNGDGSFTATSANPVAGAPVVVGDFNGDGIPDLVGANSGSLSLLLGNGDGSFQQPISSIPLNGVKVFGMVAADLNGDGKLDLAATQQPAGLDVTSETPPNQVDILLGDGHGGFGTPSYLPFTSNLAGYLTVADFSQDGKGDLLLYGSTSSETATSAGSGPWIVIPGNGDGTFSTSTETVSAPMDPLYPGGSIATPVVADLNGDGYPDVAEPGESIEIWTAVNQVASATITTPILLPPGLDTEAALATYAGDSNYSASTSLLFDLAEVPYTPTVSVTPSSSSITPSQALTVAITVSGGAGNPTPTGSVTLTSTVYGKTDFTSESYPLTNGAVTIPIAANSLIAGPNTFTVSFAVTNYKDYSSSSGTADVTVVGPDFTLAGTSIATLNPGDGASSTITITPANGFTGSVALTCVITTTPQTSALPTCSIPSPITLTGTSPVTETLTIGTQLNTSVGNFTATVTGTSGNLTPFTKVNFTVAYPSGTAASTITATPASTTIADNQSDTVTVTVAGPSGSPTPTRYVILVPAVGNSFFIQQMLSSGSAAITIPAGTLSNGANSLNAAYGGDANYKSASTTFTITVVPFNISTSTPAPVTAGGTATSTVTLNAGAGYSGKLNLICALTQSPSGAQHLPSCTLNPTSVQLATGGSGTTTLSVTTTPTTTTTGALAKLHLWSLAGGVAFAGLLLFGLPIRRKYWQLVLMLFAVSGLLITSCGGGSSNSTPPPVTHRGTTAGNYVFTVTGTDSTHSTEALSVNVTMTVQ